MTYEEIENSFGNFVQTIYNLYFKPKGFKKSGNKFTKSTSDLTQVFFFDKLLKKRKTGFRSMVIQPQIGFHNESIAQIIWPDKTKLHISKIDNCFLSYDLGLYSGTTFYDIDQESTKETVDELTKQFLAELNRTLTPIFDNNKSLSDIKSSFSKNFKFDSVDNIYPSNRNQNEFETAKDRFYYGLVAYLLYCGDKATAKELLIEKYSEVSKPRPISRERYDDTGKIVMEEVMEFYDFWNDLPFIDRLCIQFDINLKN